MHSWLRRFVCAVAIGAFLPMATVGCFGKFQLVRKVYEFNKEVDQDKWIQWFVFLVLSIIPIYGFAAVIDVVFANSVEFWTGENPVTAGDAGASKQVRGPNGEVITFTRRADGAVDVSLSHEGRPESHFVVVNEGSSLAAWDEDGRLLARVMDVAGAPTVVAGAVLGGVR